MPDQQPATVLFLGAKMAQEQNRIADSGFLYYAAQLRLRFDMECFPPTARGGDSPVVAFSALSDTLGSVINSAVMTDPKALTVVLERLRHWTPRVPKEYNPGYDFGTRKSENEAYEAARPYRTQFLSHMADLSSLLNDPDYLAAFHVVQAYHLSDDDKHRPTQEAYEKASQKLKQIAKAKGKTWVAELNQ